MRGQGGERRGAPRYPVELPVRFWSEMLEFEGRVEVSGEVSDVSWGGVFVRCDFFETPGTPVSLFVTLPDGKQGVPLKGHVAWIAESPPKGPGMGIKLSTPLQVDIASRLAPTLDSTARTRG
jgi:Tfp pilus assembly protein PilZ